MDIIGVYHGGHMALRPLAAEDEPLLVGQVLALPPQLWFKGNVGVGLADLLLGGPPSGTMLAVAHCFGLDPIQCVVMGNKSESTDDEKHKASYADEQ